MPLKLWIQKNINGDVEFSYLILLAIEIVTTKEVKNFTKNILKISTKDM